MSILRQNVHIMNRKDAQNLIKNVLTPTETGQNTMRESKTEKPVLMKRTMNPMKEQQKNILQDIKKKQIESKYFDEPELYFQKKYNIDSNYSSCIAKYDK